MGDIAAQQADHRDAMSEVIAKAWKDPEFAQRFRDDPKGVFAEHGVDIPDDHSVVVHEPQEGQLHLTIPAKPDELDDEHLDQVAGGSTTSSAGTAGTASCPVCSASSASTAGSAS